jgi:superfamily II DNA or RNA helicase
MALGHIFETVADEYEIPDAIQDGWLVPLQQRQVFVDSLDFSRVRTTAGDLNGADLAAIMEEEQNLHKVADPLYQLSAGRQTLVFAASVAHAERLAEILNRHKKDCAQFVCGTTPDDIRAKMLADYQGRKFQFLTNCAVATEGWDCPPVEVVVPKPTKSRALFAQMVGRSTRPLPEANVDGHNTPLARRQAIANSRKGFAEIIDFCGMTGRHQLISAVDILGGKYPDEVQARARNIMAEHDSELCSPEEVLSRAQQQLADEEHTRAEAAKRNLVIGKASFTSSVNKPFQVLGIQVQGRGWDKPASQAQTEFLKKHFYKDRACDEELTENKAQAMIVEMKRRWTHNLASVRQAAILQRNGFSPDMSQERAKKILDIIAGNKWRWPVGTPVPE